MVVLVVIIILAAVAGTGWFFYAKRSKGIEAMPVTPEAKPIAVNAVAVNAVAVNAVAVNAVAVNAVAVNAVVIKTEVKPEVSGEIRAETLVSTSKSSAEFAAMAKQFKALMGDQIANAKHDRLLLHALGFVLQFGNHKLIEGKELRESITPIVVDEMAVLLFHVNRSALIGSFVDQPMEKASMNDLKIHYRTYMVQLMRKSDRFSQIVQSQDHWQKKSG